MKVKIEIEMDVSVNRYDQVEVVAPNIIDLHGMEFTQGGKAKEGYKKWVRSVKKRKCPICGGDM